MNPETLASESGLPGSGPSRDADSGSGRKPSRLTCTVLIPTTGRIDRLRHCLDHLNHQTRLPDHVIVADGSVGFMASTWVEQIRKGISCPVCACRCRSVGTARQLNEAVQIAFGDVLLFMDDDVYPEPACVAALMAVLEEDVSCRIGGVEAFLTNQGYREPSARFRKWLDFMAGERVPSYAGRVIGPAVNLYPRMPDDGKPVPVEWLHNGCTAYRREAFEAEGLPEHFEGYAFMEDVHLSLRVARRWQLAAVPGARAYHDSRPEGYKDPLLVGKKNVWHRYAVMTEVMGRNRLLDHTTFAAAVCSGIFFAFRDAKRNGGLCRALRFLLGTVWGIVSLPFWNRGRPALRFPR